MSLGTLFTTEQIRGLPCKALVNHFKLDVTVADKSDKRYVDNFPLGKIPAFIGTKGFKLTEAIAIVIYRKYSIFWP